VWAGKIGAGLASAFDWGKAKIEEWWPVLSTFAENAFTKISAIWKDVEPYVSKVGDMIKSFMTDSGSMDKLVHVLELYLAVKAAGAAGDVLGGGGGGGGVGSLLSLGGGVVGQVALGAAAVAATAYAAKVATGNDDEQHKLFKDDGVLAAIGNFFTSKTDYAVEEEQYHARLLQQYGELGLESSALQQKLASLGQGGDYASQEILSMAAAANSAAGAMDTFGERLSQDIAMGSLQYQAAMNTSGMAAKIAAEAAAKAAKDNKPKGGGGGGGAAQRVEITINSNQAPGQIARAVVDEIIARQKHPRSSVHVRNFSATTRGGG